MRSSRKTASIAYPEEGRLLVLFEKFITFVEVEEVHLLFENNFVIHNGRQELKWHTTHTGLSCCTSRHRLVDNLNRSRQIKNRSRLDQEQDQWNTHGLKWSIGRSHGSKGHGSRKEGEWSDDHRMSTGSQAQITSGSEKKTFRTETSHRPIESTGPNVAD